MKVRLSYVVSFPLFLSTFCRRLFSTRQTVGMTTDDKSGCVRRTAAENILLQNPIFINRNFVSAFLDFGRYTLRINGFNVTALEDDETLARLPEPRFNRLGTFPALTLEMQQ